MNKSLLKDIFREVRKSFSKFVAILAIIAISVAFFVGVRMTAPDMRITADKYFKDTNFMDFYLVSNIGFNNDDVEKVKNIDDINSVMPGYSLDAIISLEDEGSVTRISSLPDIDNSENKKENINNPSLILGRLPENSGECVIEDNNFSENNLKIGDKIKLKSGNDTKILDSLVTDEYTIVGTINSPLYITKDRGTTDIGAGKIQSYMAINEKDFKIEAYTALYVTTKASQNYDTFSKDYDENIEKIKLALEDFASKRENERYNEIKDKANEELSSKEKEYNDAVNEQNVRVDDAKKELQKAQNQINNGWYQLNKNKTDFDNNISSAKLKLEQADNEINVNEMKYNTALDEFNNQVQAAIDSNTYEAQKPIFDATLNQLNIVKSSIETGKSQLNEQKNNLENQINTAKNEFSKVQNQLNYAQRNVNNSKNELEKGIAEADIKFKDAANKIEEAKLDIESITDVKWYIFDRDDNLGYNEYDSSSDKIAAIAEIFPIIFAFVAILICVTSMERMVEEQRLFIGTSKSLGYSNFKIMFKYLAYSSLASVTGAIIGLIIGFIIFPKFIAGVFPYSIPELSVQFDWIFALVALLSSVAITSISVIFACYSSLRQNVAELTRPKAPKAGKKVFLERISFIWKKLKFTQKVTVRNILRYKSRFFMTVIGIAGCTSLILVGFALNDAISGIGNKQFNDIFKYNISINLKDKISTEELDKISNSIININDFSSEAILLSKSVDIIGQTEESCTLIVPQDISKLMNIVTFRNRETGNNILLDDNGVVLTEKLANMLNVRVGEFIKLKISDEDTYELKVSAITENYILHYMYMSQNLYEKIYSNKPSYNQIYVKIDNFNVEDKEAISKEIKKNDNVSVVIFNDDLLDSFSYMIESINYVVVILIASAGLLSLIVIYTLTNINISERIREIATIKVLGFYENEVSKYVFRENIILTIIGSLVGLVIGNYLSSFVINTSEIDILMFGRQIYALSFILSVGITMIFTLIVNAIMLRKLKSIDMVEALKTIE